MKRVIHYFILSGFFALTVSCGGKDAVIESSEEEIVSEPMNNTRMQDLLQRVDPELQEKLGSWVITHEAVKAQIITDEKADHMRIIVPIVKVEDIEEGELLRLMQANFDSTLDARYSVANGVVWSAFIHPLTALSDEEFISGLAQAMTAAATFGST